MPVPVVASRRLQGVRPKVTVLQPRTGTEGAVDGSTATGGGDPGADRPRGSGNVRQVRVRGRKSRRDPRGGGHDEGALYFHFRSKEDLARHIIAEQHRISISAVQAIAAQEASAIEQIVMLCHEMARQIV